MRRRTFIATTAAAALVGRVQSHAQPPSQAQQHPSPPRNLLRNGTLQDDWLSLIPQNQTLHWAYATTTFYNRRDFNPDGWTCTGSWRWLDAEQPSGRRRLMLGGPSAQLIQRVHWFAIHDERTISGFPDAGGFPELRPLHSRVPGYSDFPLAACPFNRKVLGNSPSPQILNDPKSLYQGPAGASGSDSRQSFNA